jgi:hypothetical protein
LDNINETIGIIFPLLPTHIQRFFEDRKTVFVKFFVNQRSPLRLRIGSKLFFYESERNKEIVGEAKIAAISMSTPEELLSHYKGTLFLTPNELRQYATKRMDKKMLVITLEHLKRYSPPLRLKKSVTMAGRYMTEQMFNELKDGSTT